MAAKEYVLPEFLRRSRSYPELYSSYSDLDRLFSENVHPFVTGLANAKDDMFLTDHGPEHIKEVIRKASKLLGQSSKAINAHEAFLLLVAIHLHDIGNALGRKGHEQMAGEIFNLVYGPLGFDEWDMLLAKGIARVHGGEIAGSKDTIGSLEEKITWKGVDIRKQYLAAILKLADEMAETRGRASKIGGLLSAIPKSSEIFHAYAGGIESIECDAASCSIRMEFKYKVSQFLRTYGKGSEDFYLLDEIYIRTLKTYSEALYCSRYFRGLLRFDRVSVTIRIYDDNLKECVLPIGFALEPQGYEDWPGAAIFDRAPDLANFRGHGKLTASCLSSLLKAPGNGK